MYGPEDAQCCNNCQRLIHADCYIVHFLDSCEDVSNDNLFTLTSLLKVRPIVKARNINVALGHLNCPVIEEVN